MARRNVKKSPGLSEMASELWKKWSPRIDRAKPHVDRIVNPALIYTAANTAYAWGAFEAMEALSTPNRRLEGLLYMVAGAGAVAWNKFGVKRFVGFEKEVQEDIIERNAGSGKSGWAMSAIYLLAAGVSIAGAFGAFDSKVEKPVEEEPTHEVGKRNKMEFIDTRRETRGGYSIFRYSGPKGSAGDISERFDRWDEERGDKCRNTGYGNVSEGEKGVFVRADCRVEDIDLSSPDYTRIDYNNEAIKRRINEDKFEKGFLDNVEAMCKRLDMHAMGVLSVMDFETVGTYSTSIKNPRGSATGLIQFVENTAKGLGTSTAELAQMNQSEQLKFVEEYFRRNKNGGDYANPIDIAMAVFYPAAVGEGDDFVIGIKRGGSRSQRLAFRQNRGLDANEDGRITSVEYAGPALSRGFL